MTVSTRPRQNLLLTFYKGEFYGQQTENRGRRDLAVHADEQDNVHRGRTHFTGRQCHQRCQQNRQKLADAVAGAAGGAGKFRWGLPTLQCDVLYLSLEDTQRRIKDRLYNLTDSAPDNLYFAVTSGLIGGGLEEQITDFLTEQEKQKLLENARFCSLSLSEYLRRLGLGKEVRAAITERDYRLFRMLNGLKAELPQLQKEEILSRLEAILNELK